MAWRRGHGDEEGDGDGDGERHTATTDWQEEKLDDSDSEEPGEGRTGSLRSVGERGEGWGGGLSVVIFDIGELTVWLTRR